MKSLKKLFVLTFVSIAFFSCATSKYHTSDEYIPLYEDKVDIGFELIKTWRDYSVERQGEVLIYKQYEVESRLLYHKVFLKKSTLEKHGEEIEWYGNGNLRFKGMNLDGKKDGRWEYYSFKTGLLEEYGRYTKGKKERTWTFLDSLGSKTATFNYLADKLHGEFVLYTEDGDIYKKGIYDKGVLKNISKLTEVDFHPQEITEKDFKLYSCDDADEKEARKQCRKDNFNSAARIIAEYPEDEKNRKVTGTALLYIEINEDGKISEFKILRSISPHFEAAINKIKEINFVMEPAYREGTPYKTSHIISLSYFPIEGTYYFDPFMFHHNTFQPPVPNFTPPSF